MQLCSSFCKHWIENLLQMQIENEIFEMGRFSWQALSIHWRLGGMGVRAGWLAANPPGVLSQARSSHHHRQLSDQASRANTTTGFYWSKKTRDVPEIFESAAALVIDIRRKPVACNLRLQRGHTMLSFCKETPPPRKDYYRELVWGK